MKYNYKELKNKKFIKLNNKYLNSEFIKKYSIDSVLIMSILLRNYTIRGEIVFSLNYLFNELNIKNTNTNRMNKVRQVLSLLAQDNILNTDINFTTIKKDTVVRVDYDLTKKDFTIIYDFEVDTILNVNTRVNKYAMFYLFAFMKYRLNTNTKVMYWSIEDMSKAMNTKSNKTVIKYIKILEKIGLIKSDNVGMRVFKDNSIKQCNNVYTLAYLEDADKIIKQHKLKLAEKKIKVVKGKTSNQKRKIKQKLNLLWKKYKNKTITNDELKELKKYEQQYYKLYKNNPSKLAEIKFITIEVDEEDLETKKYVIKDDNVIDSKTGEIVKQEDLENANNYIFVDSEDNDFVKNII